MRRVRGKRIASIGRRFAGGLAGVFATVVGLASLAGAATAPVIPRSDPFRVPEAEFRNSVHRVCLEPPASEVEVEDRGERLGWIEAGIRERLEHAGFEVVGSDRLREQDEAFAARFGDRFDPHTGLALPERREAWTQQLADLRAEELGCDASLEASVVTVHAYWQERVVAWDGRRRSALGGEVRAHAGLVFREMAIGGVRGWGHMPALSLHLAIRDRDGRLLFWSAGGLQLAATLRTVPYQIRWDPIPNDQILTDPTSIHAAIGLALGPLQGPPDPDVADCIRKNERSAARASASRKRRRTSTRAGPASDLPVSWTTDHSDVLRAICEFETTSESANKR